MQKYFVASIFCLLVWMVAMAADPNVVFAQRPGINQDESKVPQYSLPDPLTLEDGTKVDSAEHWLTKRRPEVLQIFADHVYGNFPETRVGVSFQEGKSWSAFHGLAVRKEVKMRIGAGEHGVDATLLLTLPISDKPVACFIGYNFNGNHTTTDDPQVTITTSWVRGKKSDKKKIGAKNNQASEKGRGSAARRWPFKKIIGQGFGVATIYYGDVDPDYDDQFQNGIHPLFYVDGQTRPTKNQWGSIGAWAWALSRALDYLETDPHVDGQRVAVIGHSRLGKTSLWAGASDPRFALVVSNDSGCGGAALSRRRFGETVKVINTKFPHWFCDQFVEYNDNEGEMPADQHLLMALIAPRPVYVASATADLWADPKGEFLSLVEAGPVYALFGNERLGPDLPEPDAPIIKGRVGYHIRTGKHDLTSYDWEQYLRFADRHLNSKD